MNVKLDMSEDQQYVRIRTYTIVEGKEKINQVPDSYTSVNEVKRAARLFNIFKFFTFLKSRNSMIRYWTHYGVDLNKVYRDIETLLNTQ